jgi:hypothetical protein
MKTISQIKEKIVEIHQKWSTLGDSLSEFKHAEYYEQEVIDLLMTYCEEQQYEVEGFPFVHRKLSETNEEFDDDYFTERNELYLNSVANEKNDVFDLYHFYSNLFWPDFCETEEDTRNSIQTKIQSIVLNFKIHTILS